VVQGFSREPGVQGPLAELPPQGVRRVWRWAWVISLGGFLFGFDTGVISGALLFVSTEFGLTTFEQSSVVSVLLIGAMIGALVAGRVGDLAGRRPTLGLEGLLFVVGTAVAVFAQGYWVLLTARFILGLAVGAASATVPVYLAEVSPKEIRGRILTLNQLMITVGLLSAYLVNLAFASSGDWRAMFAVGAIPAVVILAGVPLLLPESPEWLVAHERVETARVVIASVTNHARADWLIQQRQQRNAGDSAQQDRRPRPTGWRVLRLSQVRPALIVGLTLAAVQQFGGINTIIYYAPTIIHATGLTATNSVFYSVAVGIINLVMTLVAIRLVDRAGRRVLLLVSLIGMSVTLVWLGIALVIGMRPELMLLFMVLYIAAFAIGMGPVFWVLIGEIFPPHARAAGSGVSTAVNWTSNFVVSLVFLSVVNAIGAGRTFWVFALVCALALWFVGRYVPETRNRDINQVDADLQARFRRRRPCGPAASDG
jgi:SP family galactose:H+ symporter-like MFS transporter